MASLETFDKEVKELVQSGKLSASKVKSVTDAAMANITNDAHLAATLFKAHKQAKPSHKLSSLYIVDAIAREARSQVKRGKDKGKAAATTPQASQTPSLNDDIDSDNDSVTRKRKASGTYSSFLAKIESFIDRLVAEVLTKGPPEHKEKVKKLLDIWTKTATFSPESLKSSYAKVGGTNNSANASPGPSESSSKRKEKHGDPRQAKRTATGNSSIRSTTPPYPPPEPPIRFPPVPAGRISTSANTRTHAAAGLPLATQATPVIDPSQAAQLASLLALQQTAQSNFPALGPSSQAAPAPAFEASQLALLQQLASAQAQPPALPVAASNNPFAALLPLVGTAGSPPSQAQPTLFGQPDSYNQSYSFDRRPANHRSSRDRREDDDRGHDRRDRRSASPPARRREAYQDNSNRPSAAEVAEQYARRREMQKTAPQEQLQKIPSMASSQPEPERPRQISRPMPTQTQQIASFVSDETEESRGGRFVGKREREAKARQDISEFDLDSFAVAVGASNAGGQQQQLQEETYDESYNSMQGGANNNGNVGNLHDIQSAQAFDGASFDALNAESWASFAKTCQQNMGYLPSNQEMLAWVMNGMQMMQQAAMQQMGQQGIQQGQHQQSYAQQEDQQHDQYSHGQGHNSTTNFGQGQGRYEETGKSLRAKDGGPQRETSVNEADQEEGNDSGEGEADMDMTPDD